MDANDLLGSQYLGAVDLKGKRVTVTIQSVKRAEMRDGKRKLAVYFEGKSKALLLNKTNLRVVISLMGTSETDSWVGRSITLETRQVEFSGDIVPAVRVVQGTPAANPPAPLRPTPPPPVHPTREDAWEADDSDVPF